MFFGTFIDLIILIGVFGTMTMFISNVDIPKKDKILIVTTAILLILVVTFSTGVIMCILFHIVKFLIEVIMSVL